MGTVWKLEHVLEGIAEGVHEIPGEEVIVLEAAEPSHHNLVHLFERISPLVAL